MAADLLEHMPLLCGNNGFRINFVPRFGSANFYDVSFINRWRMYNFFISWCFIKLGESQSIMGALYKGLIITALASVV